MTGSSGAGQQAVGGVGGAMAATSRPASIPAVGVDENNMSKTDNMLSGLGSALGSMGGKMNSPTIPQPQMNLANAASGRLMPTNYLLAQMNLPNLSPLSRKLQQPLLPQQLSQLNYA